MQTLNYNHILRRNASVSGRRLDEDDHIVLYNSDTGREKTINRAGIAIWQALDGISSLEDHATTILDTFEVHTTCNNVKGDVLEFARMLLANGLAIVQQRKLSIADTPEVYCLANEAPHNIDIALTGKCNLKCEYCFYANEMIGRKDLPKEDWFTFFDELKSLGFREVTISGGEVFVRPDLCELIDALTDARLRFSILTNGTLITEPMMDMLLKESRRTRLSSIQISIDGSCAEIHDRSRGEGSFANAIKALRMLKHNGFPMTCRVTINRHNVDDLENTAHMLLDDIGLGGFSTNDASPMGAGCSNQADISLLPEQQLQAMRILQQLASRYGHRITSSAGPAAKLSMYRDMERARLFGIEAEQWHMGKLTACGCIFNKLSVNHDGVITPCNILPGTVLGHITKDKLTTIWKDSKILKGLRDRRQIATSEALGCESCDWSAFCNGSCPGLACEMTGSLNAGNPHDCYRNFLNTITPEDRYEMFIEPVENEVNNSRQLSNSSL